MIDKPHIIQNAIINKVELTTKDYDVLVLWLHLTLGDAGGIAFGGWNLGNEKFQPNHGGWWITRCLEIAGVDEWSKLPGRTIRIRMADFSGPVLAIGHIVKDDWFCPSEDA